MDLASLCATLRLDPSALRAVFAVGSRVYRTDHPGSDHDFVVVLARPDARQDLLFGPDVNAITHGTESFQRALDDHSILALEAWFAPAPHRLLEPRPPFRFSLDRKRLAAAAAERARADFTKARLRFDDEPEASKKRVVHALRVALFAAEIARTGKLVRFDQASHLPAEIAPLSRWSDIERSYLPQLDALLPGSKRPR